MIEIIVALITCGGTIIGVWLQNRKHNRDISELIEYRVSRLEEKQDKHNNMIERVYQLEGAVELNERNIFHKFIDSISSINSTTIIG